MSSSPYEPDAQYAKKFTTSWIGYKVHLTETCELDAPYLITQIETTAAPMADGNVTEPIHAILQAKERFWILVIFLLASNNTLTGVEITIPPYLAEL